MEGIETLQRWMDESSRIVFFGGAGVMLDRAAAEYDENESYRYLSENYPDGKVMLGKKEREEFIDWLGVVEK